MLAAGDGTRLRPLTDRVPKPLLPIDGEPVVHRVLRQLRDAGVERATVVVGYGAPLVRRAVGEMADELALEVAFVDQPERLGSGDAIRRALAAGMPRVDSLLAAADTAWRDEDVAGLVEQARASEAVATMGLQRWPVAQLPHGMSTRVDGDGRVVRVLERVDAEATELRDALAGSPIYALGAELWSQFDGPEGATRNLADAIQAHVGAGDRVDAFEVTGARDLTRPDDLLRHNFPYLEAWLDEAKESS